MKEATPVILMFKWDIYKKFNNHTTVVKRKTSHVGSNK